MGSVDCFRAEAAGYTTSIQAWDIRPGSNFVAEMDEVAKHAERTILVLSQAYLGSDYAFAEWAAAFRCDPRGKQGKVLLVRIQHCHVEGLLGQIGYIDLVDLDEQKAREKLLAGIKRERVKPASVTFPTSSAPSGLLVEHPVFPGSPTPQRALSEHDRVYMLKRLRLYYKQMRSQSLQKTCKSQHYSGENPTIILVSKLS